MINLGHPSVPIVADTSLLINFLHINALNVLARYSRFFITDHVLDEITIDYFDQKNRLEKAVERGLLEQVTLYENDMLLFSKLIKSECLGSGECATMAYAMNRNYRLALDDKRAINEARNKKPDLQIITTERLTQFLIEAGLVTINEANEWKMEWENNYRFRLKCDDFS